MRLGDLHMLASSINTFKDTETMHTLIGEGYGTSVAPHAMMFVLSVGNMLYKGPFIFESCFASAPISNDHTTTKRKV